MSPAPNRSAPESHRVGGLRPSQLIHTYGPGAVVDLPQMSVVVAGVDGWDENRTERIAESRLLGAIRAMPGCSAVAELRAAPWLEETASAFDDWARVGVPVHPFPRWLRCTRCDRLAQVDQRFFKLDVPPYRPDRARWFHELCGGRGRKPAAVPARFMVACPAGHLDDFPWVEYVHSRGGDEGGGANGGGGGAGGCSSPVLELKEVGRVSRATDVRIICRTCGARRPVQHAFGHDNWRNLPRCRGRHPHLQRFDGACDEPTRALLLGASNAWFAVSRSSLTIPTTEDRIGQKVVEHWVDLEAELEDLDDRRELRRLRRRVERGRGGRELRWLLHFDEDDIWDAIRARRGHGDQGTVADGDLRGPEWEAFTSDTQPGSDDFRVDRLVVPSGLSSDLDGPVAVHRLREVIALCGFTRVDGPGDGDDVERIAPISNDAAVRWLPAAQTRGEGILIRLREDRVAEWETDFEAGERYRSLVAAHEAWRARRGLAPGVAVPAARFVLLHTLAHLLIHQFALDSGYSAASIRERLYSRSPGDPTGPPMAGVLLYTASPDSEGTLGGLVAMSEPARLAATLQHALRRAQLCSTDPMCADHHAGEEDDTLHAAACHACLFAPETSCEHANRYLDRAAVVPILGTPDAAYFQQE